MAAPAPRCDNNSAAWSFEPDYSITVKNGGQPGPADIANRADEDGNRFPNIVFEVAFMESEPHVLRKAHAWLRTPNAGGYGVQQVVVVNIGRSLRADGHHTMRAFRLERGNTHNAVNVVQTIEFGNHGHNNGATVLGAAGMQITVPTASIFHPALVPAGLGVSIPIDLFHIREVIELSCFMIELLLGILAI